MTYKLNVCYDGSFFCGYAKQKGDVLTIQQEIEEKLSIIFSSNINVVASGRTDKYVHALDQTISFKSKTEINPENIKKFLNSNLKNIYIKHIEIKNDNFNARFSIKSKTYMYVINTGEFDLFRQRYEYQLNEEINIHKSKEILDLFVGEKNFLSFSTSSLENTIRKINRIKIIKKNKKIYIFINGNGFLRNMVRMIVSTIINYCKSIVTYDNILNLFKNPKKGSAIYKAPGCGLYLYKTIY